MKNNYYIQNKETLEYFSGFTGNGIPRFSLSGNRKPYATRLEAVTQAYLLSKFIITKEKETCGCLTDAECIEKCGLKTND